MLNLARIFLIFGVIMVAIGLLLYLAARLNLPLGRLPGDIRIQTSNLTCYFPVVTMILVSIVLTIVLNLIARWLNR